MHPDAVLAVEKLVFPIAPAAEDGEDFFDRAAAVEAEGAGFEEVGFLGFADRGDLFRIDADGDFWFVESLTSLIRTDHGQVSPHAVENALGGLDAVDLVACHPVSDDATGTLQTVAAVTVRGCTLKWPSGVSICRPERSISCWRASRTRKVTSAPAWIRRAPK